MAVEYCADLAGVIDSQRATQRNAIGDVHHSHETQGKGVRSNHRQMHGGCQHVRIGDGQRFGLAFAANGPVPREMPSVDAEAAEGRLDARHALGHQQRFAREQDPQIRAQQARCGSEVQRDRARHTQFV